MNQTQPRLLSRFLTLCALCGVFLFTAISCGDDDSPIRPNEDGGPVPDTSFFRCINIDSELCRGTEHLTCVPDGEFLRRETEDCATNDPQQLCIPNLGCRLCVPNEIGCRGQDVIICNAEGDGFEVQESCLPSEGNVCRAGACVTLCEAAAQDRSYEGCEFYGVDLDNAALGGGNDASSQQYAIVVSNPSNLATEVWVEVSDSAFEDGPAAREIDRETLLPGDLWTFNLPRREVDGSSSNQECDEELLCPGSEVCVCGGGRPPCFCRVSEESTGRNDGTHSALSSQAYRVRSTLPIIAYQFNPLDNVNVFSNDASLLLPSTAVGRNYTVVGWPQTIADADCDPLDPACADIDFNTRVDDEDLRAFLTVVGTGENTEVSVTLGARAGRVWRPGTDALMFSGDEYTVTLGEFDVLNLETDGLNNDFTGTQVAASQEVSVFIGGEASDAPRFDTYATRQCCADHLEDQLFSNSTLGSRFIIARMPPRTVALNNAFRDPIRDSVAEVNEPEWIRIQAISIGVTTVTTTLPPPDDRFTLELGESIILRADQDFTMTALGGRPIAVLQVLPSQNALGIPRRYPGGDPAIVTVPPREQYRRDYVFLTPNRYAFDFVVITADATADVLLDGEPPDPRRCTISPADGIVRLPGDPPPREVIYRCQLSFPDIANCPEEEEGCEGGVLEGEQNDGVHTLIATEPVGVVVYGFDSFVSYAYAGGLNLTPFRE